MSVLKINHNAGFFSCCSIRLMEIIKWYNQNQQLPIVDSSSQFQRYKENLNEDVTNRFFNINNNTQFKGQISGYNIDGYDIQFVDYSKYDFEKISYIIDSYFTLSDEVIDVKNQIIKKYELDLNNVIGVCYRGNDKCVETIVPTYDEMLIKINEIKNLYPQHKILVQSDEADFYDFINQNLNDVIIINEMKAINKNTSISAAHVVNHGEKTDQAILFLAIVKILSECDKIIINSGNVGLWICYLRKNIKGVYQYLNSKEYIYGVKHKLYPVPANNWFNN